MINAIPTTRSQAASKTACVAVELVLQPDSNMQRFLALIKSSVCGHLTRSSAVDHRKNIRRRALKGNGRKEKGSENGKMSS